MTINNKKSFYDLCDIFIESATKDVDVEMLNDRQGYDNRKWGMLFSAVKYEAGSQLARCFSMSERQNTLKERYAERVASFLRSSKNPAPVQLDISAEERESFRDEAGNRGLENLAATLS